MSAFAAGFHESAGLDNKKGGKKTEREREKK
jgi:hypothetical protein